MNLIKWLQRSHYKFDTIQTKGNQMKILLLILVFACFVQSSEIVFQGLPMKGIMLTDGNVVEAQMTSEMAAKAPIEIIKENGKYYWNTREKNELIRAESGSYVTYIAINGSGFIRVFSETMQKIYDQLPTEMKEVEYNYMEVLTKQLGGIIYYGKATKTSK